MQTPTDRASYYSLIYTTLNFYALKYRITTNRILLCVKFLKAILYFVVFNLKNNTFYIVFLDMLSKQKRT